MESRLRIALRKLLTLTANNVIASNKKVKVGYSPLEAHKWNTATDATSDGDIIGTEPNTIRRERKRSF